MKTYLTDQAVARHRPAFFAAVTFLALLTPSHLLAVTCQPVERGTLDGSAFTAGTTGSDNDYRIACTGDASGQAVTASDLAASFNHQNANSVGNHNGRLVIDLTDAYLDLDVPRVPVDGQPEGGVVVLGTEGGASQWNAGINIDVADIHVNPAFRRDFAVDSHATITATDGAYGVRVRVEDDNHNSSTIRVRNFGSIEITGGGASRWNRGAGVEGTSRGGAVEVVNESGGSVTTRGPGGRGIVAGAAGRVATAINRGTISTHGVPHENAGYYERADGILAFATGDPAATDGGVARATNEGTVTTRGLGAMGVRASSGFGGSTGTASIATNRGTVTTRGNAHDGVGAHGVEANSGGGTARATNEEDATIRTNGVAARGLSVRNYDHTGRADAENWGSITTSGGAASYGTAKGIYARSDHNTAYAVNHVGATVTTSGAGAEGIQVFSRNGSADEIAMARNRGTITTTGNGFEYDEGSVAEATGMAVYSRAEAPAVAENAYTGVIVTRGTGARGVRAEAYRGGGTATARNQGRITTHGDPFQVDLEGTENDSWRSAIAMRSYARYSDATSINEVGGVIETHGDVAWGIEAQSSGGGTATAVNRGRVTTRGASADDLPGDVGRTLGARGISAYSRHGSARAGNDTTGRVDTHGKRAFGVFAESEADGGRTSGTVEVVNRGQVHTRGWNADGVVAIALYPGTADNPNHARATNTAGASVTTEGSGASGLSAGVFVPAWTTGDPVPDDVACTTAIPVVCPTVAPAASTAIARNDGTVVTGVVEAANATGDDVSMDAGGGASNGVAAAFFSSSVITSAGDVTVINTGDVTVKRKNATGLYAETFGSGTATVQMLGGSVSAEGANGRGLWARTGTTGTVDATIAGGAEIAAASTAGIVAKFEGGTTNVRLLDSVLDGKVEFGTGTDTFTVRDSRVTGAIDFGTGTDTLSAHGDTWLEGAVSNLETLTKRGSGNLVMGGDASFSSGASAVLENGGLVFTGQFDLGTTGTMTIHNAARLTAVLVDAAAPPRITAGGGITFHGNEELFVQVAPEITTTQETTYLAGFADTGTSATNPFANGTKLTGLTGRVALRTARGPSTVVEVGHIPLTNGATNTTGTSVTSGVRLGKFSVDAPADATDVVTTGDTPDAPIFIPRMKGSATSLTLGGGVSALGAALIDVFDAELPSFAQDEWNEGDAPAPTGRYGARTRDDGLEYWARSWSGDSTVLAGGTQARVHGAQMGMAAPLGGGFRLGFATAPELSVSSVRSGDGAHLKGARYAIQGAWHGERFYAGASVSQGRYLARSVVDNPVAGGGLGGAFGLDQNHAQLGAGARMTWGGMQVAPALSVHSGALRHDAHRAEGAAFRAEVPGFSQRYLGWKGELGLSPTQWLRGPRSLRWRPALHLSTQRTHTSGPASLEVMQHDRAGVLSLSSSAQASGLPRAVHGFRATVDAMHSEEWRLQLGVAGMESDGDYDLALYTRLHMRF